MNTLEFEAIGTHWQIDLFDELITFRLSEVEKKIHTRISDFDLAYSRFKPESLVTKMSQRSGQYLLPNDAKKMIEVYKKLYDLTDGAFTPLIGQVVSDAGYDADYSFKSKPLTTPKRWEEVLDFEGSEIELKEPALLDFGAGGKGYLIDLVGELLTESEIYSFCIDAGGDILYKNTQSEKPELLKVGLENPEDTQQVIGVAEIVNESICGSAGNRRSWGEFHHTIDPRTLTSPRHILATWVIAKEALYADALATALYFVNKDILRAEFEFECAILTAQFSIEKTPDFPAEFFYNG